MKDILEINVQVTGQLGGLFDSSSVKIPTWLVPNDKWHQATGRTVDYVSDNSAMANIDDNGFYIIGGNRSDYMKYYVQYYDINANRWSLKKNMNTARCSMASSTVNKIIYCIGGGTTTSNQVNTNQAYDPILDTWTNKTAIPKNTASARAVTIGTDIYVIGGYNNSESRLSINYCYDSLSNTWSTKTNIPTATSSQLLAAVGNGIYSISGVSSEKNYYYDIMLNTWISKTNIPTFRWGAVGGYINGKIYVAGGYGSSHHSVNECYDIASDTWGTKSSKLDSGTATGKVIDNKIFSFNGWVTMNGTYTSKLEVYIP